VSRTVSIHTAYLITKYLCSEIYRLGNCIQVVSEALFRN
jgi:hypothetical protein